MMSFKDYRSGKQIDYSEEVKGQAYREQLSKDLSRYGFTAIFVSHVEDFRAYSVKSILGAPDDLIKEWQDEVLNRFNLSVAIQRKWTNSQYLRFRRTGEFPEER